jgi:hypothetical protein
MTNNSTVYWDLLKADQSTWFSLHTYAWSVKSFGGRRWTAGAKRGENIMLPHRQGRIYVPKLREAQTFDLNLWVLPLEEYGRKPIGKTIEQKTDENWRKIISAFDQEGQFWLRKRWHLDSSNRDQFHTGGGITSALALAEFMDASGPDSDDGKGFYGNISLAVADPYFYGNQIVGRSVWDKVATAVPLGVGTNNVTLQGEAPTGHIWLTISGSGGGNPRITFPDGNWIQLITSELSNPGAEYVIDCQNGIAVQGATVNYLDNPTNVSSYVNGVVRRNPYFQNWPRLDPNRYPISAITVTGDASVSMIYDPAYR